MPQLIHDVALTLLKLVKNGDTNQHMEPTHLDNTAKEGVQQIKID